MVPLRILEAKNYIIGGVIYSKSFRMVNAFFRNYCVDGIPVPQILREKEDETECRNVD